MSDMPCEREYEGRAGSISIHGSRRARENCQTGNLKSVSAVITSGHLINLNVFQELGGYREDFFMDYVDTVFCLWAHSKVYEIVIACDASLEHVLGNRRKVRIGRLRLYSIFHSPQRRCTNHRNRVAMIRMYALHFPNWNTLLRMLLTKYLKLEESKAVWKGMLDNLRERMGEKP